MAEDPASALRRNRTTLDRLEGSQRLPKCGLWSSFFIESHFQEGPNPKHDVCKSIALRPLDPFAPAVRCLLEDESWEAPAASCVARVARATRSTLSVWPRPPGSSPRRRRILRAIAETRQAWSSPWTNRSRCWTACSTPRMRRLV